MSDQIKKVPLTGRVLRGLAALEGYGTYGIESMKLEKKFKRVPGEAAEMELARTWIKQQQAKRVKPVKP